MKQPTPDALRQLQQVIATHTGVELSTQAALQLHQSLAALGPPLVRSPLEGLSQEVTVLLADLRGFTAISESNPARTVLEALNRFLARMCEIAVANGGTIDKFLGDAIMVLFGAPLPGADDARRAVTCAVQMQIAMESLNRDNVAAGLPPVYMGVGINTGVVMAGTLGSNLYSEYTVIGDEVNVASRIEAFSLRGQVLISESTYARCEGLVLTGEPVDVHAKGKTKPVRLRELLAIPSLGLEVPRQDVRKSPRVEARMPFAYYRVANKIVIPPVQKGLVLDISYEGLLAKVEPGLTLYADIRIDLDLSLAGGTVHQLFGRVLSLRSDAQGDYAGIEFATMGAQAERDIRHLVHLLIQGSATK